MANVKWLEDRLRDAINVCYGGCTHEDVDAAMAENSTETAPDDIKTPQTLGDFEPAALSGPTSPLAKSIT